MRLARLLLVLPISLLAFAACGDDDATNPGTPPGTDAGPNAEAGDTEPAGPFATPSIPCGDSADSVYGDPGAVTAGDQNRGKILKCTPGTNLTKAQIQAELTRVGIASDPATSGARVFKVLYQTTRGDAAHSPGYSSAIVYMPSVPRADKLPIIVAARGSRGQAARCAVSKFDDKLAGLNDDADRLAYGLVGYGYAVIMPDLAGYANFGAPGNPPSVYAGAEDVARSTLDGSRALKNLYTQLDDKTVIVGHSQGGHSALSSLALSATYGVQGTLAAVATYSPLWFTQRSWGAVLSPAAAVALGVKTTGSGETPSAVSVFYHYTHAELLDGPGKGVTLFRPEYQATVKSFIEGNCYGETAPLQSVDFIYKMYTQEFSDSAASAALDVNCKGTDEVCKTWRARYGADRPHLTGTAATTPLFVAYGGQDTTIPPDRARCGIDRLKADGAAMTFCYEPDATHGTILNVRAKYVADWIASKTLGAAAPPACAQNEAAVTTACNKTPSNDD
jgi:pimeloyl-ACP methyl ester carboxylesterase